jgi:hypothetical protein
VALAPGARLGVYEVTALIGEGGMGEVYRARDTKLDRDVALKILPASFASDPDRLMRFEREAKTLASLNHPNIAAIYGIEDLSTGSGQAALVMELVEGEDLSTRLGRGAIRLDEALPIAKQIAEALEAAHEQGIVHRDLKPANVKITRDRRIKVLDFGIAKSVAAPRDDQTRSLGYATHTGVVIGTPAYMSPEQACGESVTIQSDIWSFGAVLYEMLTGISPFKRKTGAETVARVLESQPDYGVLPAGTPALAERLLRRCLERDRARRLQHMGDVRILVEEALASFEPAAATGSTSTMRRGAWIAIGLVGAVLTGIGIGLVTRRQTPTGMTARWYLSVPFEGRPSVYPFGTRQIAIAGDGSTVAFASNRGVQIRHVDQKDSVTLAVGGTNPFFSPDGEWVGVFNDTAIVKAPVRGGPSVTITHITDRPFGASWRADGTIVFASTEGLFSVSAGGGGEPKVIARPDRERGETLYAWPQFLPDGRSILYTAMSANASEGPQTMLMDLQSLERQRLVAGSSAVYTPRGYLVYASGAKLNAVAFDPAKRAVAGKPAAIPGIDVATATDNGAAGFALSDTGTLIFLPLGAVATGRFEWINRRGERQPLDVETQQYGYAMVSPDGTRVALERYTNGRRNVWILDLKRLTQTQLTDGPTEDIVPVWSADGRRVFFASNRSGNFDVYSQAADGASNATLVLAAPGFQAPNAMTPDAAQLLIYDKFDDLALLNLAKPDHMQPLLHSGFDERLGQVSPDGRWIALNRTSPGIDLKSSCDRSPTSARGARSFRFMAAGTPDGRRKGSTSCTI